MTAYCCYSVYFYGGRWVANPHNPRISSQKSHVVMGTVTDRDGTVLAYTDESGARRYHGSRATRMAVSQVIGDSGGKVSTGVDTFHAQYLLGFKASIFERLADAFTGTPQRGDDLQLTISERLTRYITEEFPDGKRGAAVVLNYKTGEVLSMVSLPQFDPTDVESALGDDVAGALINRATQGLYPPGSTFKIVTMASALENLPDLNDFAFDCTGYYPVGHYSVTENSAHGVQTLSEA
ncbi:MAG: penicillin-binding protein, partial [Clostridia bacterium]|nr:penicillin-binding protein [Clostridia bacterium]